MQKYQSKLRVACIAAFCVLNVVFGIIAGQPLLTASGSLGLCYVLLLTVTPAAPPAFRHLNAT